MERLGQQPQHVLDAVLRVELHAEAGRLRHVVGIDHEPLPRLLAEGDRLLPVVPDAALAVDALERLTPNDEGAGPAR